MSRPGTKTTTAATHRSGALVIGALLVAGLLACTSTDDPDATQPAPLLDETQTSTSAEPGEATTPTASVVPVQGAPDINAAAFELTELDLDLDSPVELVARSGTRNLYVAEREGLVYEIEVTEDRNGNRRYRRRSGALLDLTDEVGNTDSERGLLGLTFSTDGRVLYVSYTMADDGASRIESYAMPSSSSSTRIDTDTRLVLMTIPQPEANHNGGHIAFGPDGFLYIGLGDGGGADDPEGVSQDRASALGKILRIDPDASVLDEDGEVTLPYGIPAGNPYVDVPSARAEIWLRGVRNPWRFSFDRTTGDLWIGDVGQSEREEIDLLTEHLHDSGRGANLGWDRMEGTSSHEGNEPGDHTPPLFEYDHGDGSCAVVGGYVYRGQAVPSLSGVYLYSDNCVSNIRGIVAFDGQLVSTRTFDLEVDPEQVVSFAQDNDGELYVICLDGSVFRIDPVGGLDEGDDEE